MNAPFAWPTKYPLPKYRIRRIAIAGVGILLASCSDGLTTPGERPPTSGAAPSFRSPDLSAPDVVVMERTTTEAAIGGEAPVVHYSREVLTAQVRIAGRPSDVRSLPSAPGTTPTGLPRPPLSLPARREVGICNALPSWTERSRDANGRDIVLSGVGDAPASSIRIVQGDGAVSTVQRSWTRTATNWQLDRQVTTGAYGYRDVVTYRHANTAGKLQDNALPRLACATRQSLSGPPTVASSRTFYAPYSAALYSKLVPGSDVLADESSCGGSADDCFYKRIAVYRADAALIAAATLLAVSCTPPILLTVGPCVALTTAYLLTVANLAFARSELVYCESQPAKPAGAELFGGKRDS